MTCTILLIYSSFQICLPDSVTERNSHSMTTYPISNQYFWIVVTGGDRGMSTFSHITGSDVTVIIELGMIIDIHVHVHTGTCIIKCDCACKN